MINVVKAREEDLPEIMEIERECFSPPWTRGALLGELGRRETYFALARIEGTTAGFLILRLISGEAELFQIAVDKQLRRQGAADALMTSALEHAERERVSAVYLESRQSNAAALSLYEKHGFAVAGRRAGYYEDPREDAVIMVRERLI